MDSRPATTKIRYKDVDTLNMSVKSAATEASLHTVIPCFRTLLPWHLLLTGKAHTAMQPAPQGTHEYTALKARKLHFSVSSELCGAPSQSGSPDGGALVRDRMLRVACARLQGRSVRQTAVPRHA